MKNPQNVHSKSMGTLIVPGWLYASTGTVQHVCLVQRGSLLHTVQSRTAELWFSANSNHLIFGVIKARQGTREDPQRLHPTNLPATLPGLKIARWGIFCCLSTQNTIFNLSVLWFRWHVIKLLLQQPHRILSHFVLCSEANWIMCPFIFNSREAKAIYSHCIRATQTLFECSGCFPMDRDALDLFLKLWEPSQTPPLQWLYTRLGISEVYKILMHWKDGHCSHWGLRRVGEVIKESSSPLKYSQ